MTIPTIIDGLTIGMIALSLLLMVIGLYETFHKGKKQVEQLTTLPPLEEAIPFRPDETLASEIFSEIVAWQVSDILVACKWSTPAKEVGE